MSDSLLPIVSAKDQPNPSDYEFDLVETLTSILALRSRVPEDALTAPGLGTSREGHGVLIDNRGLVLTIGYLITEADQVWLTDHNGVAHIAHVVGYDQETGFGLVQTYQPLDLPVMELDTQKILSVAETVIIGGYSGIENSIEAKLVAIDEFAGYWEYVLDEAYFTSPAHPFWAGAALIGPNGKLNGIGSLYLQQLQNLDIEESGNMFVPTELLQPILDDLMAYGKVNRSPRPWLGMFVYEIEGYLIVAGTYENCPAANAGISIGDVVLSVNGQGVNKLADMYRQIWSLGSAGVDVPLAIGREGKKLELVAQSTDRNSLLKSAVLH